MMVWQVGHYVYRQTNCFREKLRKKSNYLFISAATGAESWKFYAPAGPTEQSKWRYDEESEDPLGNPGVQELLENVEQFMEVEHSNWSLLFVAHILMDVETGLNISRQQGTRRLQTDENWKTKGAHVHTHTCVSLLLRVLSDAVHGHAQRVPSRWQVCVCGRACKGSKGS
jgi:hypothetical protein